MKKFFALIMTLCLLLTAVTVFAENKTDTNTVKTITWNEYKDKKPEGAMTILEDKIGLKMYIPAEFIQRGIPEDQAAKGTLLLMSNKDESAVVNARNVNTDLDKFLAFVAAQGVTDTYPMEINGLKCIAFNVDVEGVPSNVIAFPTKVNTTLVFSFSSANKEQYTEVFRVMAASIQRADS